MSTPVKTDRPITIAEIVEDVRTRGDAAVAEWSRRFDKTTADKPERAVAYGDVPTAAILAAAENVRTWHAAQRPADLMMEVTPGVTLERRWTPLRSVGLYVPKNLVSSLIMGASPAQVAGVEEVVVVSPPAEGGHIRQLVLAACGVAGVKEVYRLGGATAVAALAMPAARARPIDPLFTKTSRNAATPSPIEP